MQNKSFGPSIYHTTDKNIYDAFCHRKVKNEDIFRYLQDRGIFASPEDSRADIVGYISRLPYDYFNKQFLADILSNKNRREKETSSSVKVKTTVLELKNAFEKVEDLRKDVDERLTFKCFDDKIELTVAHTIVDHTKTELSQKENKVFSIEVFNDGEKLTVRRPSNTKSKEIVDTLIAQLSEVKEEELEEQTVSLEAFSDAEGRTFFFKELIRGISGTSFDDVSIVGVYREQQESEDDDGFPTQFAGHIKKAVLDGDGVVNSPEFKQLHDSGFFISRVVWTVVDLNGAGDKFELEALFGEQETCTDFKYMVRGVYPALSEGGHVINRRMPGALERNKFTELLEQASVHAFESVKSSYSK